MMRVKHIFSLLCSLLLIACGNNVQCIDVNFIAHAGGVVDGVAMTNSREALIKARDNGFKFIELDLLFTADSMLVACHSWGEYNAALGLNGGSNAAPSLNEFLSRRLPGGLTPLTAVEINDFFMAHDSLFLVTDKISDAKVLNRFFPQLKKRMVVEAFSYKDYCELLQQGYAYVLYSCMADDIDVAPVKHMVFHWLFPGERIKYVALHTSALEYTYLSVLRAFSDFKIALFTVNDVDDIPKEYLNDVCFLYTDSLLPADALSFKE